MVRMRSWIILENLAFLLIPKKLTYGVELDDIGGQFVLQFLEKYLAQ